MGTLLFLFFGRLRKQPEHPEGSFVPKKESFRQPVFPLFQSCMPETVTMTQGVQRSAANVSLGGCQNEYVRVWEELAQLRRGRRIATVFWPT